MKPNVQEWTKQLRKQAEGYRESAAKADEMASALEATARLEALNDVDVEGFYISQYSRRIEVQIGKAREALRKVMKIIGGKWTKTFNEDDGSFVFDQADVAGEIGARLHVAPSSTCKIEVVEETMPAYTVKKFKAIGDCGSILDDEE